MKLFRVNTGSCGGCDAEIVAAVATHADLQLVSDPFEADALLLTGPLTHTSRPAFLALWRELDGKLPLLAIGRCAIDGHPFGRGGLAEASEIEALIKLDGCAADPEAIAAAIRQAAKAAYGGRAPAARR